MDRVARMNKVQDINKGLSSVPGSLLIPHLNRGLYLSPSEPLWALLSGFKGGLVDSLLMRVVDIKSSFPGLLLTLTSSACWGLGSSTP